MIRISQQPLFPMPAPSAANHPKGFLASRAKKGKKCNGLNGLCEDAGALERCLSLSVL